jgi:hypothetical protein
MRLHGETTILNLSLGVSLKNAPSNAVDVDFEAYSQ